jgi:hypothetical protein
MSPGSSTLYYENRTVRLIANRKIPEISTPGITIKEIEAEKEFETMFWVARELVRNSLARYSEEALSQNDWTQVHFKERLNPAGPPSKLIDDFYPRVYQSFSQSRENEEISERQLNRTKARFREVLESRISRIARIAASKATEAPRTLEPEEMKLYEEVHQIIGNFRERIREFGEE